ncbi:MAG: hypothetical protein ACR2GU_10235 [Rubrobacteraceae bacterium]
MILDLLRALPAALLLALLPGWFWARALCPGGDSTTLRLVYSTALSLALVPAVALALVRILGSGVTLPVILFSAVGVFGAGLAAYRWFGPAEVPEEPLAPRPDFSPGLPVLVWLIFSSVLMLLVSLGPVPMLLSLPFLALALIYAIRRHRSTYRTPSRVKPRATDTRKPVERGGVFEPNWVLRAWIHRVLLLTIILLVLFRGYSGPVIHDWPFIRGVDQYNHAVMANEMLSDGKIFPYLIYPPGFHTMTAGISRLSGLDPLRIFPVLAPTFLLLPALSLYALARRLWGAEYGLAAALFAGLLLNGPYEYFSDAMYPNMVTSQFLLVLAVTILFELYTRPSARTGLLFALLGSSVVLYHQVASLYLALLLLPISVYLLPRLFTRDRLKGVTLLLSLAALGVISFLYAWDTYNLSSLGAKLLGGSGEGTTGSAVLMTIGTQVPFLPNDLIGTVLTQPVTWLGLFGAFLLCNDKGTRKEAPYPLVRFTLLLWLVILIVGSVNPLTGFPQRFSRDLGMPLALMAALVFVSILSRLVRHERTVPRLPLFLGASLMVAAVAAQAVLNLEDSTGKEIPLTFTNGLTVTPRIAAAGEWLREHNDGGNIMVSPQVNQVPSRMMLAMGHYSALQSYTAHNLDPGRDLPPGGAGPMRDVLWVMNHPASERARDLLKKYDVRYIALYKHMPDRPVTPYWRQFAAHPDLYRTTFTNKDVLIVAPREAP